MKIAVLQDDYPPYHLGGAGVIAQDLAVSFSNSGHEVIVITTVQDKSLAGTSLEDGVTVIRLFTSYSERWRSWVSIYNPSTVEQVDRIFRSFKPDVVHAHNVHFYLSYATLNSARASGATVYLTAHDAMLYHYGKPRSGSISAWEQLRVYRFRYNPFRNLLIRRALRSVKSIVAVSTALATVLRENDIPVSMVIHNGIDLREWDTMKGAEVVPDLSHLQGKRGILFAGRISREKGGDAVVDALLRLLPVVPDAVLLVVGHRTSYISLLQKKLSDAGHLGALLCVGWLDRSYMPALYSASEVVVVPSLYIDPFPTVVLEAMASRRPVIATIHGGAHEVVVDGITGYTINPTNAGVFAQKLQYIFNNTDEARKMGEAGHARIEAHFTLDRQALQYLTLFEAK